jgi:hypothetical protein
MASSRQQGSLLHTIIKLSISLHPLIHQLRPPESIPQIHTPKPSNLLILRLKHQVLGVMNLNLLVNVHTHVFGVDNESWYGERVLHALSHGCGVRGVKDKVQDMHDRVVEECEGRRSGGEVTREGSGREKGGNGSERQGFGGVDALWK